MRIGFIGLGKLGLPCAEEMTRQHEVIGYDTEHRVSAHVNITQDIRKVFKDTEIIFVAVPTLEQASCKSECVPHLELNIRINLSISCRLFIQN